MFSAVRFYSDMLRHKSLFNTKALSQIPFIHVKIPKNKVCVCMYVCMYVQLNISFYFVIKSLTYTVNIVYTDFVTALKADLPGFIFCSEIRPH